jgi:hypothetical protein
MMFDARMGMPQLYSRDTLASLDWPETPDGDYARRYLLPMMTDGAQKYIRNVHNTRLMIAKMGGTILPVTVTDFHPDNTYTCSPYSHYVSYGGFEEIQRLKKPLLEALIKLVMYPLAGYFRRADIDRVAFVNNWLLSTNLYPPVTVAQIDALCAELPKWFPDRAIVFRSVDSFRNPLLFDSLRRNGYEMVLSRQVWYQEPKIACKTRQFREDVRVTKKNGHVVGETLTDDEFPRAVELYNMLYLQKYSYFNPQFTGEFLRLSRDEGVLTLRALRRDGKLNAVMGYFARNGAMTAPLFGYDTGLSPKDGLYRMLSVVALQEGLKNDLLVHASGGVGTFKKLRGGQSVIEYNAVFTKHLPRSRQLPWKLIGKIGEFAIPVFQKNDF